MALTVHREAEWREASDSHASISQDDSYDSWSYWSYFSLQNKSAEESVQVKPAPGKF